MNHIVGSAILVCIVSQVEPVVAAPGFIIIPVAVQLVAGIGNIIMEWYAAIRQVNLSIPAGRYLYGIVPEIPDRIEIGHADKQFQPGEEQTYFSKFVFLVVEKGRVNKVLAVIAAYFC